VRNDVVVKPSFPGEWKAKAKVKAKLSINVYPTMERVQISDFGGR